MLQNLAVHIRFHEGRYHGSGDWPPAPARLFQAFVAAASIGRRIDNNDREALLWLERQKPPTILAPFAKRQKASNPYMPNNDLDTLLALELARESTRCAKEAYKKAYKESLVIKRTQSWLFNSEIPVIYLWEETDNLKMMDCTKAIANHLYQLGRGVDFAWAETQVLTEEDTAAMISAHGGQIYRPIGEGEGGYATPTEGSLDSLQSRYEAFLNRLRASPNQGKAELMFPNQPRFVQIRYNTPPVRLHYEIRSLTKSQLKSFDPAQAGFLVQRVIRFAAKKLIDSLPDKKEAIEKFLIGRNASSLDAFRRVRVFAVPTLRYQGDRAIRRIAVEIPANCPLRVDDLEWAFNGISPLAEESKSDGVKGTLPMLVPATNHTMFERYYHEASIWRSETPLALPIQRRRIDPDKLADERKGGKERILEEDSACRAVFSALRHANINIRPNAVQVQREPYAVQGTKAEAFAVGTRFSKHALWHVKLTFQKPVSGPLILGDGRFQGLGLMVPNKDEVCSIHAFAIVSGLRKKIPSVLTRALRRAVMAQVQAKRGQASLHPFFTGHKMNGSPLRGGNHRHIAFLADLPRQRLLVISPHIMEHHKPSDEYKECLGLLEDALAEFSELRAGSAGRLQLVRMPVSLEDPLFRPARVWESLTPYRPTRHPKRTKPETAVAEDILVELGRHGLPKPKVECLRIIHGPRGGLEVYARLTFSLAVKGPILLGRTMHFGGGLFVGVS